MAEMIEKYDTALLGILQNEGEIKKFLEVIIGFLYRRTDYFLVMHEKMDKMGFPPGIAMKILISVFKQFEDLASKNAKRKLKMKEDRKRQEKLVEKSLQETMQEPTDTIPPPVAKTMEISSEPSPSPSEATAGMLPRPPEDALKEAATESRIETSTEHTSSHNTDNRETGNEAMDEEDSGTPKVYQANPECYNGAVRENYCWSQSITDLDVRVKVPQFVKKGNEVKVIIGKKHLKVSHKPEAGGDWPSIVDADITWEINKEECMWTLDPKEHIVNINLEKKDERWWEALLEGEPKINVRKIDASRPMSDLDDEAQTKIEEMMYNERQKRLGLPQSHEKNVHEILKKAWDADGSPFKGQPFDPSKVQVDPSGTVNIK